MTDSRHKIITNIPRGVSSLAVIIVIVVVLAVIGAVTLSLMRPKSVLAPSNQTPTPSIGTVPEAIEHLPIVIDTKPIQADDDPDGDGLRNELETQYKTDPKNKDTDDDGLKDGEEIAVFRTDPLKKDTDGDGVSDGDEVRGYSNALDSKSVPPHSEPVKTTPKK